ncbi:MAG TPA: uroporphyrinogen-III synthase [Burkholderiaceae bacterium]|jgi:uroporphyrinogen-III synthase
MLILTRPRPQAQEWLARLRALGLEVQSLPLIEIERGDGVAAREAWGLLPQAALAMFVSPNAVAAFFAVQDTSPWPAHTLAACVGPGSAQALREAGVPDPLIVQPPADSESLDSEHLWPQLSPHDWGGRLALMLRGEGGRDWLGERLRERGAQTRAFNLYRRVCPHFDAAEQALLAETLKEPGRHVWLLSSAEALGHLRSLAPAGFDFSAQRAIATHERIGAAAHTLGFGHVVLARPDAAAVSEAYREL